ncbi:hypothetical protein CAOG_04288 [Capsaspora owczarzaki ATCC 30864]|uniref:RING-type E3 ubiquitin transferase n=1 Tax=Capsaspora owczarzaki (strain ATCC 30864) TaxID=595528 RepID=A0A0D2WQY4_CAPO3|nr:hypothetical protein CAOG_04288 [Capsaspora owczarzaki ATCC 30864]KJE93508.1 hypothetical protein CAOG_004288 [Capsaspora owczarzaki ATCC 30864]|eukprot:XP_004348113.2 hypothetical protein CAOG_04288 [Capsaspora owczarzaki ATCC 30864]
MDDDGVELWQSSAAYYNDDDNEDEQDGRDSAHAFGIDRMDVHQRAVQQQDQVTHPHSDAKIVHAKSVAEERGTPARNRNTDDACPVCLGDFVDKTMLESCFHIFCYECIRRWSAVNRMCPLCKTKYSAVIHHIRSETDFVREVLSSVSGPAAQPAHQPGETTVVINRRLQERINAQRTSPSTPLARSVVSIPRTAASRERRRVIYANRLRAMYLGGGAPSRCHAIDPASFQRQPQLVQRLVPWIARDLDVLLADASTVTFVLNYILSLLEEVDLQSNAFVALVQSFLHEHSEHFVHELVQFARSTLDMAAYDRHVQYAVPDAQPQRLVRQAVAPAERPPSLARSAQPVSLSDEFLTEVSELLAQSERYEPSAGRQAAEAVAAAERRQSRGPGCDRFLRSPSRSRSRSPPSRYSRSRSRSPSKHSTTRYSRSRSPRPHSSSRRRRSPSRSHSRSPARSRSPPSPLPPQPRYRRHSTRSPAPTRRDKPRRHSRRRSKSSSPTRTVSEPPQLSHPTSTQLHSPSTLPSDSAKTVISAPTQPSGSSAAHQVQQLHQRELQLARSNLLNLMVQREMLSKSGAEGQAGAALDAQIASLKRLLNSSHS